MRIFLILGLLSFAAFGADPDTVRVNALLEHTKSPNSRYVLSVDFTVTLESTQESSRDPSFSGTLLRIVRRTDSKTLLRFPFPADENSDKMPPYHDVTASWSPDSRYVAVESSERFHHHLQLLRVSRTENGDAASELELPDLAPEVQKRIKGFKEFRTRGGISLREWLPKGRIRVSFDFDYITEDGAGGPGFTFILRDDGTKRLKIEQVEEHE